MADIFNVPESEIWALRSSGKKNLIYLFCISECQPCDLLVEAVPLVTAWKGARVVKYQADTADKRQMGRLLLNGIRSFPTVEIHAECGSVQSISGMQGDSPQALARWLDTTSIKTFI